MKLIQRLRNLWELSAYRPQSSSQIAGVKVLQKDIPTIQKKMATIIPEEKADLFEEPHDTSNQ